MTAQPAVEIPDHEIEYSAVRSSGPGGQHVNKTNTAVVLRFSLDASQTLTEQQKSRIRTRLSNKITQNGDILVRSERFRSQQQNKTDAKDRLHAMLEWGLKKPKIRKKTRIPRKVNEKRLENKKRRGETKKFRRKPDF